MDKSCTPYLMYLYYTNRTVLFLVCLGNEMFFMLLYCYKQNWDHLLGLMNTLMIFALPVMAFKQFMNLIQLVQASTLLASRDLEEASSASSSSVSVKSDLQEIGKNVELDKQHLGAVVTLHKQHLEASVPVRSSPRLRKIKD